MLSTPPCTDLHVLACQFLRLALAEAARVHPHAALGAAELHIEQAELPRVERGQAVAGEEVGAQVGGERWGVAIHAYGVYHEWKGQVGEEVRGPGMTSKVAVWR